MTAKTYPILTGYAYSNGSYVPPTFSPTTNGYNGGSPEYIVDNNPSATQINVGDKVTLFDDNYGQSTVTYLGYYLNGSTEEPLLYGSNGSYALLGVTAGRSYTIINGPDTQVACYCIGTLIRTVRGEVAVENLSVGDLVVSASGSHRPIKWLGHREIDTTAHPTPRDVWPVLVRAGAFSENMPDRDLWLSPGHNVVIGGALLPIILLCNGRTIEQVRRPRVDYWHVELESHDIIFAGGLPAESYLDTGNRCAFENGGAFIEAHPDFRPKHFAATCLPLLGAGPELVAAKRALLARAGTLGHLVDVTDADDLHILADGRRVEAQSLGNRRMAFLLPEGCERVALKSRSFVPAHHDPASDDQRELGVQIARLQIDGEDVSLDREEAPGPGWHAFEPEDGARWTGGPATLPPGTRLVVVDLLGRGHYWADRAGNLVPMFG